MHKRNYVEIARILKSNASGDHMGYVDQTARDLAEYFAKENPQFDRQRFLKACGVQE